MAGFMVKKGHFHGIEKEGVSSWACEKVLH